MRIISGFLLVCGLAILAGCGGSANVEIEGTVTYDGKPIDQGAISFEGNSKDGKNGGGTILEGKYIVPKENMPKPGTYTVKIYWSKKTGKKFKTDSGELLDDAKEGLPEKYNAKSELTAEVKAGKNDISFDLKK